MVCADPLAESYALERPAADPVDSPNEDGMVDAATGTLGADLKPPAAAAAAAVPAGSAAAPAGGHSPSAALCNKAQLSSLGRRAQSAEGLLGAGGPLVCSAVAMPLLRDTASIVGVLVFYHCQRREADAAVLDLLSEHLHRAQEHALPDVAMQISHAGTGKSAEVGTALDTLSEIASSEIYSLVDEAELRALVAASERDDRGTTRSEEEP
ncbi:hypothetical protein T492DRAFT_895177 [Pavlovales sp. CCMP2436]|nr:hypothetical protein T492DRAFT_895177 [Pavlovales sp. CCMP2436]